MERRKKGRDIWPGLPCFCAMRGFEMGCGGCRQVLGSSSLVTTPHFPRQVAGWKVSWQPGIKLDCTHTCAHMWAAVTTSYRNVLHKYRRFLSAQTAVGKMQDSKDAGS